MEKPVGWLDFDYMHHDIALRLGLLPLSDMHEYKGVHWSNNPLGNFLCDVVCGLVKLGEIEHDQEEHKFRWKEKSGNAVSS